MRGGYLEYVGVGGGGVGGEGLRPRVPVRGRPQQLLDHWRLRNAAVLPQNLPLSLHLEKMRLDCLKTFEWSVALSLFFLYQKSVLIILLKIGLLFNKMSSLKKLEIHPFIKWLIILKILKKFSLNFICLGN